MPAMVLTSDVRTELVKIAWEIVQRSWTVEDQFDSNANVKWHLDRFAQAYAGLVAAEIKIANAAANPDKESK